VVKVIGVARVVKAKEWWAGDEKRDEKREGKRGGTRYGKQKRL